MLIPAAAGAQRQSEIDSLAGLLKTTGDATTRVDVLNALAEKQLNENYEHSLQYATEALELSQQIGYPKGELQAHYLLGRINVNYTLNYKEGLTNLLDALKLVRETSERQTEMDILRLVGFVHRRQGDVKKAQQYYDRAIAIAVQNNFPEDYEKLNSYAGDLMESAGNPEQARTYYERVLDAEKRRNFQGTPPYALLTIGRYYLLRKDYGNSKIFYSKALAAFEANRDHRWTSYTYSELAGLYLATGDFRRAIENGNKGLELAKRFSLVKEEADNHRVLAAAFDSLSDFRMAYLHFKAYTTLEDSINTMEQARQVAFIQGQYESAVQKQELAKSQQAQEIQAIALRKDRIIVYVLSAALLLLVSLVFFLGRSYRQKQRVYLALTNREELRDLSADEIVLRLNQEVEQHQEEQHRLAAVNEELSSFMYRSSHDLKGPLASIIGITNIARQKITGKENSQYMKMIAECTNRLSAILDDLLSTTRVSQGKIHFAPIRLEKLAWEVVGDLRNADHAKGVEISIDIPGSLEFMCDEILLRAILQNMIDNSLKYKNPSRHSQWVKVTARKTNSGVYIRFADNGLGIEKDRQESIFDMFVRANAHSKGSGLGLYIVKKSIERLGGTIELNSEPGIGSAFSVFLPDQQATQQETFEGMAIRN